MCFRNKLAQDGQFRHDFFDFWYLHKYFSYLIKFSSIVSLLPKSFLFLDSWKTNLWDSSLVFAFLAKISQCAYRTSSRISGVKISRHEEKINLKPVTLVSYRSNLRFRFSIRREKCSSLGDRGARASFWCAHERHHTTW